MTKFERSAPTTAKEAIMSHLDRERDTAPNPYKPTPEEAQAIRTFVSFHKKYEAAAGRSKLTLAKQLDDLLVPLLKEQGRRRAVIARIDSFDYFDHQCRDVRSK